MSAYFGNSFLAVAQTSFQTFADARRTPALRGILDSIPWALSIAVHPHARTYTRIYNACVYAINSTRVRVYYTYVPRARVYVFVVAARGARARGGHVPPQPAPAPHSRTIKNEKGLPKWSRYTQMKKVYPNEAGIHKWNRYTQMKQVYPNDICAYLI